MASNRTGFLRDDQIKALTILARMRADELKLSLDNPMLIDIYETSIEQLARFR